MQIYIERDTTIFHSAPSSWTKMGESKRVLCVII